MFFFPDRKPFSPPRLAGEKVVLMKLNLCLLNTKTQPRNQHALKKNVASGTEVCAEVCVEMSEVKVKSPQKVVRQRNTVSRYLYCYFPTFSTHCLSCDTGDI